MQISVNIIRIRKRLVRLWRELVLSRKIIYTLLILILFVVAGTFTVPGIKLNMNPFGGNSFLGILDLVGGGGLRRFSIVSLGISPFITASLIMQLLQTKIFPPFHQLSKMGPLGRRKLNLITRGLTIVLSYTQAISVIKLLKNTNGFGIQLNSAIDTPVTNYLLLPLILMGGSLFTLFLAEQITQHGVGNGTSLIIYTGIALTLPSKFRYAFYYLIGSSTDPNFAKGVINFCIYVLVFLILILIVSLVFKSERRLPIQQMGAGLSLEVSDLSWLPIKANPGGIMPLIFASIILSIPFLFSGFLDQHTSLIRYWIEQNLSMQKPLGFSIFAVLTLILSVFMSIQQTRIDRIIEDFGKTGTFIPGIRPGDNTEDYILSVVIRLSVFSAVYLLCIGSFNYIQQTVIGLPQYITFGGTSVVILITSSLETVSQVLTRRRANQLVVLKRRINRLGGDSSRDAQSDVDLLW